MTPDLVGVVETFYSPERSTDLWAKKVVEKLASLIHPECFTIYGTISFSPNLEIVSADASYHPTNLPRPHERLVHAVLDPTVPGSFMSPQGREGREQTLATYPSIFLSQDHDITLAGDDVIEFWQTYAFPAGVTGNMLLQFGDLSHRFMAMFALFEDLPWKQPEYQAWDYVTAHMNAGYRLQRAVQKYNRIEDSAAILDGDGTLVEVFDHTLREDRALREAICQVAQQTDRARGQARHDPLAALALWQGLVEGEYSLVDHFDTDGRRFVLLKPNAPEHVQVTKLSRRERQVVTEAAKGFPNKLIGYNLGISSSTVSTLLQRACSKLGIQRRAHLIELVARLHTNSPDQSDQDE